MHTITRPINNKLCCGIDLHEDTLSVVAFDPATIVRRLLLAMRAAELQRVNFRQGQAA